MADNNGHLDLDGLFDAARRDSAAMPEALSARMLADAARVQAGFAAAPSPSPESASGLWRQMLALLGGWPAMGGLAAACAAGVWLGMAPPDFLPDPAASVVSATQGDVDVLGGYSLSALYLEDG